MPSVDCLRSVRLLVRVIGWGGVGLLLGALAPASGWAQPVTVVAFGDSTTAPRAGLRPYPELLQERLDGEPGRTVKVINAGVRGNTTKLARERFDRDVLARDPRLVIIQFGLNDSAIDVWKTPPAAGPRVPLPDYQANLAWFVSELQRRGIAVVLMTPNRMQWTPVLHKQYGHPPYDAADPDGFNLLVRPYAGVVRSVAQAADVPLVDVLRLHDETARTTDEPLLLDGMHPNQRGHERVTDRLVALLRERPDLLAPAVAAREEPGVR